MEKNSNLWKILAEVNDAIKFAEEKAIGIISTSGILTAFLFSKQDLNKNFDNKFFFALFSLCIAFLFASIIFSLLCLKPNFSNKSVDSVFYFNAILKKDKKEEDWSKDFNRILGNEEELETQISEQVLTKSKIARRKYRFINLSIYSFIAFLAILLMLMVMS